MILRSTLTFKPDKLYFLSPSFSRRREKKKIPLTGTLGTSRVVVVNFTLEKYRKREPFVAKSCSHEVHGLISVPVIWRRFEHIWFSVGSRYRAKVFISSKELNEILNFVEIYFLKVQTEKLDDFALLNTTCSQQAVEQWMKFPHILAWNCPHRRSCPRSLVFKFMLEFPGKWRHRCWTRSSSNRN